MLWPSLDARCFTVVDDKGEANRRLSKMMSSACYVFMFNNLQGRVMELPTYY